MTIMNKNLSKKCKQKRKQSKMSTSDAIKILANESKQMKTHVGTLFNGMTQIDKMLRDYVVLFEHYIEHTSDGQEFVEKMKKLVEEKVENDKKTDEPANEQDTGVNIKDKGGRTARIRP